MSQRDSKKNPSAMKTKDQIAPNKNPPTMKTKDQIAPNKNPSAITTKDQVASNKNPSTTNTKDQTASTKNPSAIKRKDPIAPNKNPSAMKTKDPIAPNKNPSAMKTKDPIAPNKNPSAMKTKDQIAPTKIPSTMKTKDQIAPNENPSEMKTKDQIAPNKTSSTMNKKDVFRDEDQSDHENDGQDETHSSSPSSLSSASSPSSSSSSSDISEESETSSGSGSTSSADEQEEDNDEGEDLSGSDHVGSHKNPSTMKRKDVFSDEDQSDHENDDQDETHSSSPSSLSSASSSSSSSEISEESETSSGSGSTSSDDEEEEDNDEEEDLSDSEQGKDEFVEKQESDLDNDDEDGTHTSSPSSASLSSSNGSDAADTGSGNGSASSGGEEEEQNDEEGDLSASEEEDDTEISATNSGIYQSLEDEEDESLEENKSDKDEEEDDEEGDLSSLSAASSKGSDASETGSGEEEEEDDEEGDLSDSEDEDYAEIPPTKTFQSPAKVDDLGFQLIDGNSNFKDPALNDFATEVNLYQCGRSYAVIAIMGPQSSGKSTLLNHLFQTKFKEMDGCDGRSQTTQGIWLARCPTIKPLTLVMDIEGTDGSERGEDDTTFEKRSALFALAVADVVLVNMWCHDIGREQAASKPLLKVVFEQVLLRFSNKPRKITLMFVVRDKTRTPEQKLEAKLRSDVEKIWDSIKKPKESCNAMLRNFFKVEVVFLPNYEEREEDFKSKVMELKQRFFNSTAPGGLADSGEGKEPGSGFAISAQNIWKNIMENKDLNLPLNKILVATTRCQQIITELLDTFETNEDWCNLRKEAFSGFIPDFGKRVNSILNTFLSMFDAEASYYDEAVRTGKQKEFVNNLLKLVHPVYQAVLNHLRLLHLKKFMEAFVKSSGGKNSFATVADRSIRDCLFAFDKDCEAIRIDLANWDTLKERVKLQQDMKRYLAAKGEEQIASMIRRLYEPQVKQELSDSVGYLLCEEADPTWRKIRERFNIVMQSTITKLNTTLSEFSINEEERREKIQNIEEYAKQVVEVKAREESGRALEHMIRKFLTLFKTDHQWKSEQEIVAAAKEALYTPLDILSGLAAVRLEAGDIDNIHQMLSLAFRSSGNPAEINHLASSSWAMVPPSRTLLTPIQCLRIWAKYIFEADKAIKQANEDLKKRRPRWIRFVLGVVNELVYIPLKAIDWVLKKLF